MVCHVFNACIRDRAVDQQDIFALVLLLACELLLLSLHPAGLLARMVQPELFAAR